MNVPASIIVNASLGASDPQGGFVFTGPLGGFPVQGNSFAAISSGVAANASLPNDSSSLSAVLGGLDNSQGNDLVQLILTLNVMMFGSSTQVMAISRLRFLGKKGNRFA